MIHTCCFGCENLLNPLRVGLHQSRPVFPVHGQLHYFHPTPPNRAFISFSTDFLHVLVGLPILSRHQESNTWLLLEWMSVAFCRHPIHLYKQCFYLERNGLQVCPLMEFPVGDFVWPLDSQKPPEIIYLKNFQHLVYAFGDPSMILLYIVTYSRCCRSEHVDARKSTKVVSYI